MITRNEAQAHNKEKRLYYISKFDSKCNYCESTDKLELDHIIPITTGGDNSEENIQVLCSRCNKKKGGRKITGRTISRTKRLVPYQIRIEPELLVKLRKLADDNGTSVNHEIRQFIRKGLGI